jgi:hypothetical protein
MSTFTPNIGLEQPAHGAYDDNWDVPVNADWGVIDTCFGGTTTYSVTGALSGTQLLTLTQYQPRNIEFTGLLAGNVYYVVPNGVGGTWSVFNNTTQTTPGQYALFFGISGGGSQQLAQGYRTLLNSDGINMSFADGAISIAAYNDAVAFAEANVLTATTAFCTNASNLNAGTVPNAQLPNAGAGPGITIAADPGTVPTGTYGQLFYYY